jgi:hypothetical protein
VVLGNTLTRVKSNAVKLSNNQKCLFAQLGQFHCGLHIGRKILPIPLHLRRSLAPTVQRVGVVATFLPIYSPQWNCPNGTK